MEEALEKERTRIYEEQAAAINTLRQECDELQFQLHKEREGRQVRAWHSRQGVEI